MKPFTTRAPFDATTRWLHWITVLLIVAQFGTIWGQENVADPNNARLLLTWHRTLGLAVWVVTVARFGWRLTGAVLPPFPDAMTPMHRLIAKANEYTLYALLFLQPLTGLGMSIARGRAFSLVIGSVPMLMARDKPLAVAFGTVHEICGYAILVLAGLHAAAALLHHYVWRDGVLASMAPWFKRERAPTKP